MSLPDYAKLKMIALLWSAGKLSTSVVRALRELGVSRPSELDRIIHELHRELMRRGRQHNINVWGDGPVIVGLLTGSGVKVYEAYGDGRRKPLQVMTDNGHAIVELGPNTAEIIFEADYTMDMFEYMERYGPTPYTEDLDLHIANIDEVDDDWFEGGEGGREIRLDVDGDRVWAALLERALSYYGADAKIDEAGQYIVTHADAETIAKAIGLARNVMYEDFDEYAPWSVIEDEMAKTVTLLQRVLKINVKRWRPAPGEVHVHGDTGTVHVHATARLTIEAPPELLISHVAALIVALNTNLLKAVAGEAVEAAKQVYRIHPDTLERIAELEAPERRREYL